MGFLELLKGHQQLDFKLAMGLSGQVAWKGAVLMPPKKKRQEVLDDCLFIDQKIDSALVT